ncbi:protein SPO16 homolog [Ptychodera flava]|uniref:protein SPO16 homolog n=1 Tax=Ptychodera flava TaxID=63121 RepID=UPI003969E41A
MSEVSSARWPVIVNSSLYDSDMARQLQREHKIRYSDNTIKHTCIFPLSSIAFIIVPVNEATTVWPLKSPWKLDPALIERIERFVSVHCNGYLIVTASLFGQHEMTVFSSLQDRFLKTKLRLLPAHNASDCVQCMLTIAKATCKPASAIIKERMNVALANQLSEVAVIHILSMLGLNQHDILFQSSQKLSLHQVPSL